jgi:tRNA pseudouridine55 synthase
VARKGSRATIHGVLVLDKPVGPTSHDVVLRVRRALGTRTVGHSGTLDPLASGVLVVAVGEATKLVRWLTADDKAYVATVALGKATDTLDAEGEVILERPLPDGLDLATVRAAAARFLGTHPQRPPVFSAIKVGGRALHERARAGEEVEVPERAATLHRIEILAVRPDAIDIEIECAKGFYVRSLGRDLAEALGTVGHLTALRRTRSGAFDLARATPFELVDHAAGGDEEARAALLAALVPLAAACGGMPVVVLDAVGAADAMHGRAVRLASARGAQSAPPGTEPLALLDESGELVAVARRTDAGLQVIRGFRTS